ncbi:MAG: hypothetical protein K2Y29_07865 [Beijerinckiaceae bacterium]|nr:hypothetical protein [Beijerinckiaceae bacterium]
MLANVGEVAMVGFIVAIIIAGCFGPWVISLILGAVCVGCLGLKSMSGGEEG